MLIPTILTPFIYSLLVLAVEAHNSRLKQTTRRQVTERASLHFRPRQATTSSTLFPTCPESQTHASTPYATFSKVAYFNTDNYFVCTSHIHISICQKGQAECHRFSQLRRLLMPLNAPINATRTKVCYLGRNTCTEKLMFRLRCCCITQWSVFSIYPAT